MNEEVAQQVINKAMELNESPPEHLDNVSKIVNELSNYIDGKQKLNSEEIRQRIIDLTLYTSLIPVPIPLASGIIISRAVKYEENDVGEVYDQVSRLSYIPQQSGITPKKGRINQEGESIFYACLNADANSVGAVLLESRAIEGDTFNLLHCRTVSATKSPYCPPLYHQAP